MEREDIFNADFAKVSCFGMALFTDWWLIGWDPVVYFAL